jgi:hypothetical protein
MIRLEIGQSLLASLVAACTCEPLPMIRLDTKLPSFCQTSHRFITFFLLIASSPSPFKIGHTQTILLQTSSNKATCIVGGLVHVRIFTYLHHWQANLNSTLFILASLVPSLPRYLHHWQAPCYFSLLRIVPCATCIIGKLGHVFQLSQYFRPCQ